MSLAGTKQQAKNDIKQILEDMLIREDNSTEEFANRLIDIMEQWLKQATIKYTTGLIAGSNAVTGTFNGGLE